MLVGHEGVEDGRHDEVGYSTTRVAPSTCKRIGCSDDVLVEEAGGPDLTWDERATEDTDEESDDIETSCVMNCTDEDGWDCTEYKAGGEGHTGSEAITSWTGD